MVFVACWFQLAQRLSVHCCSSCLCCAFGLHRVHPLHSLRSQRPTPGWPIDRCICCVSAVMFCFGMVPPSSRTIEVGGLYVCVGARRLGPPFGPVALCALLGTSCASCILGPVQAVFAPPPPTVPTLCSVALSVNGGAVSGAHRSLRTFAFLGVGPLSRYIMVAQSDLACPPVGLPGARMVNHELRLLC